MAPSFAKSLVFAQTSLLALTSLFSYSSAQQYAGDTITNSLPAVDGSEIAFFKVVDANGNYGTLTNYYALNSTGGRIVPANVKRAVIFMHGLLRDPYLYIEDMLGALSAANAVDDEVTLDNVAMFVPYFANGDDKNIGYPWTDGLKSGRGSTSNALVWKASGWASGEDAQYPAYPTEVVLSSYDCLDQVIQYFDDKTLFPNMNQIVVGGHSLGAQMTQRYAAVGAQLNTVSPVTYYVANPDSLLWFTEDRVFSTDDCSDYDDWRQGLSSYTNRYGDTLVASGRDAVYANYQTRHISYAHGLRDFGDDSSTCGPDTTGANRGERFYNFINTFPPTCDDGYDTCCTIDYVNTTHNAPVMMESASGQARLFFDNFNGDQSMAYDIWYPRRQDGDDPFPNPNPTLSSPVQNSNYGGMTFAGCWTESDTRSLSYPAWTGNNANSITACTAQCLSLGFTVAGSSWTHDCYCDHAISFNAIETGAGACGETCAGNSSEYCGMDYRLSVWAVGDLVQNSEPTQPETVDGFTSQGCWIDNYSDRALTGASYVSANMTLENCADYCSAYTYFGTGYGDECYCGNELMSGSATNETDCNYPCADDSTEYCGQSVRLTLYEKTASTVVTMPATTTSAVPSATATTTTTIDCDSGASNNTVYTAESGDQFRIYCGMDRYGNDIGSFETDSLVECIETCDITEGCVDVATYEGVCWMKSGMSSLYANSACNTAEKI